MFSSGPKGGDDEAIWGLQVRGEDTDRDDTTAVVYPLPIDVFRNKQTSGSTLAGSYMQCFCSCLAPVGVFLFVREFER